MNRETFDAVKKATVAIVISERNKLPNKPFTIIGSGFCIDPRGIIITCAHVHQAFVDPEGYKRLMEAAKSQREERIEVDAITPYALFFSHVEGQLVHMVPVPIQNAVTRTDFDLAIYKIHPHSAFAKGYPALEIAKYEDLHEMMEVATCGYPLGDMLQKQMGTVTSSFTKGVMSSIIPVAGVSKEDIKGFQLNLTATNGNSGGPVFCPRTGKVFGILQGGPVHHSGHPVQGLTRAEPIYPLFFNDTIERLASSNLKIPPAAA